MAEGAFAAETVPFTYAGRSYRVRRLTRGTGLTCLLLPALSSISTLAEMVPLAKALDWPGRLVLADWPGFGAEPAPASPVEPAMLHAYLTSLLAEWREPPVVVAAGHAASYALKAAGSGHLGRLAMLAPTWRGPLPTMMGGSHRLQSIIRRAVELPLLGQALYRLNLSQSVVRRMLAEHVMSNPATVTPDYLAGRAPVIGRRHARFATAAFVTGGLDPFPSREDWLKAARAARVPLLAVIGEDSPRRSLAEMTALAEAGVPAVRLKVGRLGLHEEFPLEVAAALRSFLKAAHGPHAADGGIGQEGFSG